MKVIDSLGSTSAGMGAAWTGMRHVLAGMSVLLAIETARAQHDGARDAVQHIAEGRLDRVSQTLATKKPFVGDAESAFVEMLRELAEDDLAGAMQQARRAVDLGLPFERLTVGPRELLSKLHAIPEYQDWQREQSPSLLVHGPMVGKVTGHGASIWVRTAREAKLVVKCEGAADAIATTDPDRDWTAVFELTGLQPDTSYPYTVESDGVVLAEGRFRTFVESGASGTFAVGFGGGAGYIPEWETMWETILARKPHAFLMLGDNVYIDHPEHMLTQHYCYYRRQSRPEWKRLTANTAIYSIWDDHDFGTNDCVPGPEVDRPAWKRSVWNVFQQNWVNPGYGDGAAQPGCWYDFRIGDVHFLMLDGRYYRDLKGGSMLGAVQKQWLLQTLSQSDATFKVIASPVPFTEGVKRGSRDPWDGFPEEREQIFRHIESEQIEGVFLIAADRHRTDLRVTRRPNGYDLYEFESSRLTNQHTHGVVATDDLVWGYNTTCSFALMTFDTTLPDPQVQFECVSLDGKTQYSYQLRRSQLSFSKSARE